MKIDFKGAFNIFNEIFHVRQMSIAERILIRQKKDFINCIAIHVWTMVKTILVFGELFILTQYNDYVPFSLFWVCFFTGLVFLIFDSLGIKAIMFFFRNFFIALYKMLKESWINIKLYFTRVSIVASKYKLSGKFFYWSTMIILFPLFLSLYVIVFGFVITIHAIVFGLLIFNGNEALSLLIMVIIGRALPLDNDVVFYSFYVISVVSIYFAIDYRIRMTEGSLINKETKFEGHNEVVGMELLSSNNKISIYKKDNDFYIFDNETDILTIFGVHNRLEIKEKGIVDWIEKRNKKRNQQVVEDNKENIVENEILED